MSMWLAIGLVGLGSYAFRVIPMLLGEFWDPPESLNAALKHGAVGAMTALLILDVRHAASDPLDALAVCTAVAVSGGIALLGRPLPLVVLGGGMSFVLSLGIIHVVSA